jgi:hypothetical protein
MKPIINATNVYGQNNMYRTLVMLLPILTIKLSQMKHHIVPVKK